MSKTNESKVNKSQASTMPGVTQLNTDQGMGHYNWGKKVAGHDGKKQHSPVPSMGAFKDKPVAVGYTPVERKMTKAAAGGKTTQMTSNKSQEPKDTHTKSPVRKFTERADPEADYQDRQRWDQHERDVDDLGIIGTGGAWAAITKSKKDREELKRKKPPVKEADQVDPNQDPNAAPADPNAQPAEPAPQPAAGATADTVLDQLPDLVAHAKERKVLDPSYNQKALAQDIADSLGVETTDPLVAKVVKFISVTEKISESLLGSKPKRSFKNQVHGDESAGSMGKVLGKKPKKHPFNGRLVGEDEELPAGEDTVTLDVPLLIRVMEYAKEDAKTDMELHKAVERMLSIGGALTMDDYDSIVSNLDEDAIAESVKQRLDAKCWTGKHKEGTKIKGGVRVNNCVANESVTEDQGHGPVVYLHKSFSSNIAQAKEVLEKYHSIDGAPLKVSPPSGKYGRDYVEIHLPAKPYNTVDDVERTLKSAGVDFASVKEGNGMTEDLERDQLLVSKIRKLLPAYHKRMEPEDAYEEVALRLGIPLQRLYDLLDRDDLEEAANAAQQAAIAINMKKHHKKPKDKLKESFDDIRNEFNKIKEEFEQENPVVNAVTRRIMMQRSDLLAKYGPEAVTAAIDDVAEWVGDVEEIGSSDVSAWVKHVEQTLGHNVKEQTTIVKQRSIPVRSPQVIERKMQNVREAFQAYKQGKK